MNVFVAFWAGHYAAEKSRMRGRSGRRPGHPGQNFLNQGGKGHCHDGRPHVHSGDGGDGQEQAATAVVAELRQGLQIARKPARAERYRLWICAKYISQQILPWRFSRRERENDEKKSCLLVECSFDAVDFSVGFSAHR